MKFHLEAATPGEHCTDCNNRDADFTPATHVIEYNNPKWYREPVHVCIPHLMMRFGTFLEATK